VLASPVVNNASACVMSGTVNHKPDA
jgi:hypothetical protein